MRHIAVLTLVCLLSTFAGRARGDETVMVPVPDAPPPAPPALLLQRQAQLAVAPPAPLSLHAHRRKVLLTNGAVFLGVGVALTAIGTALYVTGKQSVDACNRDPNMPFLCGLGGAIDEAAGTGVLITGGAHLATAIITLSYGAATPRD